MPFQEFLSARYPALTLDAVHGSVTAIHSEANDLQHARHGTVLAPLFAYGLVEIEGEDAADFLHKQLTNDVLKLPQDAARHAAWCTAKGRMLCSLLVYREQTSCFMVLAHELAESTRKRMQMFILRAKAKAHDRSADHMVLGLSGPQAEAALLSAGLSVPAPATGADALPLCTENGIKIMRLEAQRFVLVCPLALAESVWNQLAEQAQPVGQTAWRWLDIQAGLPVVTGATVEEFVPQMVDFDRLGGVNFKKGCYPGQEVVARAHYLGKVKRHLYRISAVAPLHAGEDLFAADHEGAAGKVVSAVSEGEGRFVGLAVLLESAAASACLNAPGGPAVAASKVYPDEAAAS